MLFSLHTRTFPPSLQCPILCDSEGLPRFWATVWGCLSSGSLAESTLKKRLLAIDRFYSFADELLGDGGLDDALATLDFIAIQSVVEAFFLDLGRMRPCPEDSWTTPVRFVRDMLTRIAQSSGASNDERLAKTLHSFHHNHAGIRIGTRRRPPHVRSLPATVIDCLYGMLDPESSENPFRPGPSRWRVYILFILLLHQGLRRGELLCLPTDAVKSEFNWKTQKQRYWITVRLNPYEADPRTSRPSIKTSDSIRQIPVSEHTARLVQEYVANHRGRPNHSFLLNSQKNKPLSTEMISATFRTINSRLPSDTLRSLESHLNDPIITPHAFRHTCAVVRLNQLLSSGVLMDEALQQMRSFFGWSRSSREPLRYARAVFEDRLATIWRSEFDERVEVLRALERA